MALPVPHDRLETLPLFDEPFWFAEPKGRRRAAAKVMTEDELRGQRLLLLTEGHCLRDQALAICRHAPTAMPRGISAPPAWRQSCIWWQPALGSTLLPAMACGDARARAVATRPLEPGIGRCIGLVWRRNYARVRDVHLLAKTLRDHLPKSVRGV